MRENASIMFDMMEDTRCDICGSKIHDRSLWPDRDLRPGDSSIVEIQHRIIEYVGDEAVGGRTLRIECCPRCWVNTVVPLISRLCKMGGYRAW